MKVRLSIPNDDTRVIAAIVACFLVAAFGYWLYASHSPLGSFFYTIPGDITATTTLSLPASTTASLPAPRDPITSVHHSSSSVLTVVRQISGASRFAGLLNATGVASAISGKGPYTIFVPTNNAFGQLPSGTISSLSSSELKRLVEYHIVNGRSIDVSLERSGTIQALSRDMLNFSYGSDKVPMVNSAVVVSEYQTRNGIVYVVDTVLIPPTGAF